jgi:hypothetical protein
LHGSGFVGATHPTWRALAGLLFSQHRGLFATAPLMAVGLCALPFCFRALPRSLFVTVCASVLYFFLIVSSSSVWFGGWSYGPRLLLPIFGLLALPAAVALDRIPSAAAAILGRTAAILGIALNHAVSVTFPELPENFTRPLADSVLPLLRAGLTAPNLGCKLATAPLLQWLPLGLLIAATLVFVALRGVSLQAAAVSLLCAACAFAALASVSPSITARQHARWLAQARGWHAAETRCKTPDSTLRR